jgi:hypothetical protein
MKWFALGLHGEVRDEIITGRVQAKCVGAELGFIMRQ